MEYFTKNGVIYFYTTEVIRVKTIDGSGENVIISWGKAETEVKFNRQVILHGEDGNTYYFDINSNATHARACMKVMNEAGLLPR